MEEKRPEGNNSSADYKEGMKTKTRTKLVFTLPPEGFEPQFEVAGCFIKQGNEFLFLQSVPKFSYGSAWGIPGGKLEKNETPEEGVVREVLEETQLALDTSILRYFGKVYCRYLDPRWDFVFHMFEYEVHEKPTLILNGREHLESRWVTLQAALQLDLIPGEAECIHWAYDLYGKE
jgi:8-oxo-dGTP diphosphatase